MEDEDIMTKTIQPAERLSFVQEYYFSRKLKEVAKLNKEGVTIIMVSHDLSSALRYASHILHIGSRKQLFFGTKEAYTQSRIGRSFIESEEAEKNE